MRLNDANPVEEKLGSEDEFDDIYDDKKKVPKKKEEVKQPPRTNNIPPSLDNQPSIVCKSYVMRYDFIAIF